MTFPDKSIDTIAFGCGCTHRLQQLQHAAASQATCQSCVRLLSGSHTVCSWRRSWHYWRAGHTYQAAKLNCCCPMPHVQFVQHFAQIIVAHKFDFTYCGKFLVGLFVIPCRISRGVWCSFILKLFKRIALRKLFQGFYKYTFISCIFDNYLFVIKGFHVWWCNSGYRYPQIDYCLLDHSYLFLF